jgi:hypothetical protein
VDVSKSIQSCPFLYPVAMTRAASEATIAASGRWIAGTWIESSGGSEELKLPGGQARLHTKARRHKINGVFLIVGLKNMKKRNGQAIIRGSKALTVIN